MNRWMEIRRKVLVEGISKRQVMADEGIHWETLKKILANGNPPGYRLKRGRKQPIIGPFLGRIEQILKDDKSVHKKQRHTAKRIFERLRDEDGYQGKITQVKEAVRGLKQRSSEVYVPLEHAPGEAQVDFGHALVKLAGQLVMRPFFVMALPYSDAYFVQVFERETTEVIGEGHNRAFVHFGGVPHRISYDNPATLVAKRLGCHKRELNKRFKQLVSHYLFETHFCNVRRGNEKGVVEGGVKYARLNFMVPVPVVNTLDELNTRLIEACLSDLKRKVRGRSGTKEELLVDDRAHFLPMPEVLFDASLKISTTASSLSLVRFDCNDYSVPTQYAHHPVVVKGSIAKVEIYRLEKKIAQHERLWIKEGVSFDPLHYLAILEGKPGALDHARPLKNWQLPDCFALLRRRMEAKEQNHGDGTREYIRTLRLMEKRSLTKVTRAVKKAVQMEIYTRDGVAQLLIAREELRLTTFSLDGREHLRGVHIAKQDLSSYGDLLGPEEAA
jgi:transposase